MLVCILRKDRGVSDRWTDVVLEQREDMRTYTVRAVYALEQACFGREGRAHGIYDMHLHRAVEQTQNQLTCGLRDAQMAYRGASGELRWCWALQMGIQNAW